MFLSLLENQDMNQFPHRNQQTEYASNSDNLRKYTKKAGHCKTHLKVAFAIMPKTSF